MKYSINSVKTFRGMEGMGFNANLLADGKKVCLVMDSGDGGCYRYEWADYKEKRVIGQHRQINGTLVDCPMTPAEKAFNDYVNAMPSYDSTWKKGEQMYHTEDCVMGSMIDAFELLKYFKAKCKKQTLYTVKGDKPEEYRTIKADYKLFKPLIIQELTNKHGKDFEIINERFN